MYAVPVASGGGYRGNRGWRVANKWKKKYYSSRKRLRRTVGAARKAFTGGAVRGSEASKNAYGESYALATADQKLRRQAGAWKGAGDYRSALKWGARGIGAIAGGMSGFSSGGIGGAIEGARSGYGMGSGFSKYVGWGDYQSTNQIMGGEAQQQISVNKSDNSGDIYIEHTEFVQNISCSIAAAGQSTFQLTKFQINPGMNQTFPFLSQLAQNYQLYEFQGLIFQYKPTSGESSSASNALGKIIMATQYDPSEPAFINSVQMENEDYANSTKPSLGMLHGVETHPGQSLMALKYVRTGQVTRDLSFCDLGSFYVGTEGIPFSAAGSMILGELWVTYRIRLSRANLYGSLLGLNISQDVFTGSSAVGALANTIVTKSSNTIGCTIANVSATALSITFPINIVLGSYQIFVQFTSNATVFTTQSCAATTNFSNIQFWIPGLVLPQSTQANQRAPFAPAGTTSNGAISIQQWIIVQAPGALQATLQLNVSAALTATTTYLIMISQVSQGPSNSLT